MQQYIQPIFPVNIYSFIIQSTEELNEDLLEEVYEIKEEGENFKRSNKGGFHSCLDLNKRNIKPFDALNNEILRIVNQIIIKNSFTITTSDSDKKEDILCKKISEMWFIINGLNDFNVSHTHIGCWLSGAYYLKLPKETKSYIYFEDPIDVRVHEGIEPKTCIREVVESELILFPSWISHKVPKNTSNEDRIVISFNIPYMPYIV